MTSDVSQITKPDGSPFKFLIVDDSAFMRKQLTRIISQVGGDIAGEAENGLIAVEKYKELNPDVVTMDITMPEMNGVEALRSIIEFDEKAIVIMVTAVGHETIVKQAIMLGAKHFVVKPFKPTDVAHTLEAVVKRAFKV